MLGLAKYLNSDANVPANRAPTVGRQARAGEDIARTAYRQPGPGGLPLALRLSEGGSTLRDKDIRVGFLAATCGRQPQRDH
jgi:hypothetical protein